MSSSVMFAVESALPSLLVALSTHDNAPPVTDGA